LNLPRTTHQSLVVCLVPNAAANELKQQWLKKAEEEDEENNEKIHHEVESVSASLCICLSVFACVLCFGSNPRQGWPSCKSPLISFSLLLLGFRSSIDYAFSFLRSTSQYTQPFNISHSIALQGFLFHITDQISSDLHYLYISLLFF